MFFFFLREIKLKHEEILDDEAAIIAWRDIFLMSLHDMLRFMSDLYTDWFNIFIY